jgi:hypothetical protein
MSHNIRKIAKEQLGASAFIEIFRRLGLIPPKGTPEGDAFQHPSQLVGVIISKELVDTASISLVEDIITELRGVYSAAGMRTLRSNMGEQRNPLLNLIRQVGRANGLHLEPKFQSNGYDADGRKRVRRWFVVKSMDISSEIRGECPKIQEHSVIPEKTTENLRIMDAVSEPEPLAPAPAPVRAPEPESASVTIEFPQQEKETEEPKIVRRRRKVSQNPN